MEVPGSRFGGLSMKFDGAMMRKTCESGEVTQTVGEEIANSITHGIGFLLSCACLTVGVVFAALHCHAKVITSVAVYGATMCILYLSSTLFHAFPAGSGAKRVFHVFDHCSIFLLIAGTYTPIVLGPVSAGWGWSLFGVIWGLAIAGIVFKAFFTGRFRMVSTLTYLAMGWLVLVALKPVLRGLGPAGFLWLAVGGLCYSVGCVFYVNRNLKFAHAIWHLFVLAGTVVHFFCILLYVVLQ